VQPVGKGFDEHKFRKWLDEFLAHVERQGGSEAGTDLHNSARAKVPQETVIDKSIKFQKKALSLKKRAPAACASARVSAGL
jgi:hypothetical protein